MKLTFVLYATLLSGTALMQAQSLLDTIRTPDKSVPAVNQTLEGTWLQELLLPGQPAGTGTLNFITFLPDGSTIGIGSDGSRSPAFGLWARVGDRKFLITNFLFNYDEKRVLDTVTKVRVNVQISTNGQTMIATAEIVVMDKTGKVMATVPGGYGQGNPAQFGNPGRFL